MRVCAKQANRQQKPSMHIGKTSVRLKLKPGAKGTKSLVEKYGDQLVCVRYRYDAHQGLRYKTAELIVDQAPWARKKADSHAYILVHWKEKDLQTRIKAAGGKWNTSKKLWKLDMTQIHSMGLKGRMVKG
jgi:hypothetical protein